MARSHICTPKRHSGVALLNEYEHVVAQIFSFLKVMFEGQLWAEMITSLRKKVSRMEKRTSSPLGVM